MISSFNKKIRLKTDLKNHEMIFFIKRRQIQLELIN